MIIPEPNFDFDVLPVWCSTFYNDVLPVWYSELNYYMTHYECDSLDELDRVLWCEYGVNLVIL